MLKAISSLIFVAGALSSFPLQAESAATFWSEKEPFSAANRAFADQAAKIKWQRELGDWVDVQGQPHGASAFQSLYVKDRDKRQYPSAEITRLVKQWLDKPKTNQGLLLRNLNTGKARTEFYSRESGDLTTPAIELQLINGTTQLIAATADTYLTASSRSAYGDRAVLKVGPRSQALIHFAFPKALSANDVSMATLYLTTDRQFGDNEIGIYQITKQTLTENNIERGIADQYPDDENIIRNPDVLFSQNFESNNWSQQWSHIRGAANADTVELGVPARFIPLSGKALRLRFSPEQNLAASLSLLTRDLLPAEPESLYFRYYLRLGDNWNSDRGGGKFPGFGGTYDKAGWGGRPSDGTNGWSARGNFFDTLSQGKHRGKTPLGSYLYLANSNRKYGERRAWGSSHSLLEKNRWYAIEQYLKLNTPNDSDGEIKVWIDGRQIASFTSLKFRTTDKLNIEKIWFDFFHGGVAKPSTEQHLFIDNIVVAKDYIGPIKNSIE
ncbi:hypothetical protein DV711_04260 [Motiliproteus coralliicola]|uniref:Polysaccharide lyase 14 domain-containing protein n=1 Tax=Motiliproteus coralliicola TaxID=2283196 RepID=A0A369WW73_9GAMM|nr:DNRLRE domain-containing protein [Motiliproteus coralliicola]RDE24804.1 hypothetical protein DV711_04260 [Motiliproteus coralliicola]